MTIDRSNRERGSIYCITSDCTAEDNTGIVHSVEALANSATLPKNAQRRAKSNAWGDSNLYLRRHSDDRITLSVEHRAAPAIPAIGLELVQRADALALEIVERTGQKSQTVPVSVDDRIAAVLADAGQPRSFADLRAACRIRAATLYERLAAMTTAGRIVKSADGYRLAG